MKNEVKKFEVGKTYYRIANDDSAAWKVLYKVTKRTEKTAIFEDVDGEVFKKKIYADMGEAEAVMIGKTQIISASDVADEETAQKVIPVENETDGSEDDAEEENVAMTIDYNFDVEEDDDDELIDEAEAANLEVDVTEYAVIPDAREVTVEEVKKPTLEDIAAVINKTEYLVKSMSKYGAWATFKYETLQDAARSVAGIFDKEYYRGEVAVEVTNFQSDVLYSWELAGKNFPTLTEIETALHISADLEKHFKKVQDDLEIQQISIELDEEIIKRKQKRSLDLAAWMTQNENEIYELFAKKIDSEKAVKNLTVAVEELQAEITNRKLNAAAVGMVDDGTNEEDAETLTVDYNFDVEENDDELIDPPIEYHIEFAAVELEPVTFAIERFGEDNAIAQKFSAVVDLAIEEFALKVKGIIAAIKGEDWEFDVQLFNGEEKATKETAVEEVPVVDEDFRKSIAEFEAAKFETSKRKLDEKFQELKAKRDAVEQWAYKRVLNVTAIKCVSLISQVGDITAKIWKDESLNHRLYFSSDGYITGDFEIAISSSVLAKYSSIKNFKAAIEGLVAAIERGDEVYTFPADNALVEVPAVVEKVPTLDEDARIKEIASEITAIGAKIEDWLDNRDAKMDELRKYLDNVEEWAFKKVHGTGDDAWKIILVTPDKKKMCLVKNKDSISLDGVTFQVSYKTWNHVAMIDAGICSKTHAVIYDTISEFKAAIEKIVTAINAGKKSVTLPTPTDAEKNAKK